MNWGLFLQLMRKDWAQFIKVYPGKFIDTCILFTTSVLIFGYFFPKADPDFHYGSMILIGSIASFGLFDIVAQVGELIFDIQGDRTVNFTLAMPGSSSLILGQFAIRWAWNNFLVSIPLFLIGKLLLWNQYDLSHINIWQLIIFFPIVCLFLGFFSLWLAAIIRNLKRLSSLYFRFINPLFMFGCFFFSWHTGYELSHVLGYCLLINPMVYVMEGMRVASLGQEGYLPFWISFCAVLVFTLFFATYALRSLKKRLDCI